MEDKDLTATDNERSILLNFFARISALKQDGQTIGDSRYINDIKKQLRNVLRGKDKCTCYRCKYTICEVCQASDIELVELRNFFRVISKVRQNKMSTTEIQEFIENTRKHIGSL